MKTRINPVTGREEYWNEPPGLPGLWIPRGFCDRCHPFNQCLGLMNISDEEWNDLENKVDELVNDRVKLESVIVEKQLKKCTD
jgi:hypothetical protein